jgi:hypothetical protein
MGIGGAVGITRQDCLFVGARPLLRIPRSHAGRIVVLLGEQCLGLGRWPWGTRPEHDAIAGARAGCQHAVVADLVGTGRWNEWDQSLEQLAALHEDVRRPVAPAGLEPQREPSIGLHFEAIVCERRAGDVAAEPLEPAPVASGDGDVGM